jgi:hypothetical protein
MTNRLKSFDKSLSALLAAGFLLYAGGALAAGSAGAAQTQARQMLLGSPTRGPEQSAQRGSAVPRGPASRSDAQLSARQLLLGNPDPGRTRSNTLQVNAGPGLRGKRGHRGQPDAQEQAQRLIQGRAV